MKKIDEIVSIIPELSHEDLDRWISRSLIEAERTDGNAMLTDTQFARVRLICTLCYDMDVEEETLPLVLDLLDQLHENRRRLFKLSKAVLAQDKDVRTAVLETLLVGIKPKK